MGADGQSAVVNGYYRGRRVNEPDQSVLDAEERLADRADQWANLVKAGYKPSDYGYDKNGRKIPGQNLKPDKSAAEMQRARVLHYENAKRQRSGQAPLPPTTSGAAARPAAPFSQAGVPLLGGAPDVFREAQRISSDRQGALSAGQDALLGSVTKGNRFLTREQEVELQTKLGDPNGQNFVLGSNGKLSKSAAQDPAMVKRYQEALVSMGGVMPEEPKSSAEPVAPPAKTEDKKPEVKAQVLLPQAGPPAPKAPAPGSDEAVAAQLKEIEANEKYNTAGVGDAGMFAALSRSGDLGNALADSVTTPASAVASSVLATGALGNALAKRSDKLYSAAVKALGESDVISHAGERAARIVNSKARGAAKIVGDILPRATEVTSKALAESSKLNTALNASKTLNSGVLNAPKSYEAARYAKQYGEYADDMTKATKRVGEHGVKAGQKLAAARGVAAQLADEAGVAATKADKLITAANKSGAAFKGLKGVGKVASKVAVPLQVGLMAVEGGRLALDPKLREQRVKDFEGYADKGKFSVGGAEFSGRAAAEAALNPVAGFYTAGRNVSDVAESRAAAKRSGEALALAGNRQARMQKLIGRSGKDLKSMSQKDRSAFLRSIRAQL